MANDVFSSLPSPAAIPPALPATNTRQTSAKPRTIVSAKDVFERAAPVERVAVVDLAAGPLSAPGVKKTNPGFPQGM